MDTAAGILFLDDPVYDNVDIMTLVLFQFDIVFQKLLFSVYADTDISVLLKLFKRILERSLLF